MLPVLPDPVPRDAERALARLALLGEGVAPATHLGIAPGFPGMRRGYKVNFEKGSFAAAEEQGCGSFEVSLCRGRLRSARPGTSHGLLAALTENYHNHDYRDEHHQP